MSSVFKALQQLEFERNGIVVAGQEPVRPIDLIADSVDRDDGAPQAIVSLQAVPSTQNRIVAMFGENSLGAEKFKVLSTRLRHLQQERRLKKVVVTSGGTGEGKSLIAANLAATLARSQRVLLLEGDMRRPTLSGLFGFAPLRGLSDYLTGAETLNHVVYSIETLQLHLLPAGNTVKDPMQLLESRPLVDLLNEFAASFDWIIIDSPPLTPLADTSVWARLSDGLLLVVRGDQSSKGLLQKGVGSLNGSNVLGVVLNDFPEAQQKNYAQYRPSTSGEPAGKIEEVDGN